jgi:hypothetical protein
MIVVLSRRLFLRLLAHCRSPYGLIHVCIYCPGFCTSNSNDHRPCHDSTMHPTRELMNPPPAGRGFCTGPQADTQINNTDTCRYRGVLPQVSVQGPGIHTSTLPTVTELATTPPSIEQRSQGLMQVKPLNDHCSRPGCNSSWQHQNFLCHPRKCLLNTPAPAPAKTCPDSW